MAKFYVSLQSEYYPDPAQGRPISNGKVYIGQPGTDPHIEANRIDIIVRQEDGTEVPIAPNQQPMFTSAGGVVIYNGSPVQLLVEATSYAIAVDQTIGGVDTQVYYVSAIVPQYQTPGINDQATATQIWITDNGVGIGVVPNPNWDTVITPTVVDIGQRGALFTTSSGSFIRGNNAYFDGTTYRYKESAAASNYSLTGGGDFTWSGESGTRIANDAFTFEEFMRLDNKGILGLKVNPESAWDVNDAVFRIGGLGSIHTAKTATAGEAVLFGSNFVSDGVNNTYIVNDEAARYFMLNGRHVFQGSAPGTPGSNITFTSIADLQLAGTTFGNPTGGPQGSGTVNAQGFFINGVPIAGGTPVTGYVNTTATYQIDKTSTVFNVASSVTVNTWESIGPTGSGATHIWTQLDDLPAGTQWIEITTTFGMTSSGASMFGFLSARPGGSTWGVNEKRLYTLQMSITGVTGNYSDQNRVHTTKIALDSNRVFEVQWQQSSGTVDVANLALQGFGV